MERYLLLKFVYRPSIGLPKLTMETIGNGEDP
jgi:hypothetical protein